MESVILGFVKKNFRFLRKMGEVFQSAGQIVPFVFAIGSYDVGFEPNSVITKTYRSTFGDIYYVPNWLLCFPQNYNNDLRTPFAMDRNSYLVHKFSSITLITLDSGFLIGQDDKYQLRFLETQLAAAQSGLIIVQYSESLYPSCITGEYTYDYKRGQEKWGRLFEKYNVKVVFENGCRYFKRTKPLKNNQVDPANGVIYVGDGNFGSTSNYGCDTSKINQGLFEKTGNWNHYWTLAVSQNSKNVTDGYNFRAYDLENSVIDDFQLKLQ
jgi:hypothetical protein